jgi:hypothetical protein
MGGIDYRGHLRWLGMKLEEFGSELELTAIWRLDCTLHHCRDLMGRIEAIVIMGIETTLSSEIELALTHED